MSSAYVSRSTQKKRRTRRILLILAAFVLLFVAFLMVGLMLKSRSDYLRKRTETESLMPEPQHALLNHDNGISQTPMDMERISISFQDTSASLIQKINALPVFGRNGFTFPIIADSGEMYYATRTLAGRFPISSRAFAYDTIREVLTQTSNRRFRSSIQVSLRSLYGDKEQWNSSLESVILLVSELEDLGFSEVILTDIPYTGSLSYDQFAEMRGILSAIRRSAPLIDIGVSLLPSVYLSSDSVKNINNLSLYADFLALNLEKGKTDITLEDIPSLANIFSFHTLRALLTSGDIRLSEWRSALSKAGCRSFQLV